MSTLSERLNEAARIRGVNQAWIAEKTDTSTANMSRYFQGKQNPVALEIVAKVAKVTGISTDFLLGVSDSPFSREPSNNIDALLMACYVRTTDADKKVLWALLSKYALPADIERLSDEELEQVGLK